LAIATGALLASGSMAVLAACDPGRGNIRTQDVVGTQGSPAGVSGVRAYMLEYDPSIEVDAPTSAWVMLNRGVTRWAQVGWHKYNNGVRNVFTQHTNDSGTWFTNNWPGQPVGTSTTYRVQHTFEDGFWRFKFWRGNTQLTSVSTTTWIPTIYSMHAETHNKANQMPGGTSSHMRFTNAYYYVGGTIYNINTAAGESDDTIHKAIKVSAAHYEVWDLACAN
jgi:hypothetical protein